MLRLEPKSKKGTVTESNMVTKKRPSVGKILTLIVKMSLGVVRIFSKIFVELSELSENMIAMLATEGSDSSEAFPKVFLYEFPRVGILWENHQNYQTVRR